MLTERQIRAEIALLGAELAALSANEKIPFEIVLDEMRKRVLEIEILAVDLPGLAVLIGKLKTHIAEAERMSRSS